MSQLSDLAVAWSHYPVRIIGVRLHDGVFVLQAEADEEIVEDTCAPDHGLADGVADADEPLPPTDVTSQWARRRYMRQARAASQSGSQRQPRKSPPTIRDSLMVVPDSESLAESQPHAAVQEEHTQQPMEADTCATTVVDEHAVTVAASQGSMGSSPRPDVCGQRAAMDAEMDTCVGVCGSDHHLDRDGDGDRHADEDNVMLPSTAVSQRTPSLPRRPGVEAEDDLDTRGVVCADDTMVSGWRQADSPPDLQPDSVVMVPATLFPDTCLLSVVRASER